MRNDRPAFAAAPAVKRTNNTVEACHIDRPRGICGFVDEKKSINRPMKKGIDIDTDEDTSKSPTAVVSGLRSGFARDTIFRSDDEDVPAGEADNETGRRREIIPVRASLVLSSFPANLWL